MPFSVLFSSVNPTELAASSTERNYLSDDMSLFLNGAFYDGRSPSAVYASNAAASFQSIPMSSQQSRPSRQSQKMSLQNYILKQFQAETDIADNRRGALDTFKGDLEKDTILDTLARLAHTNKVWSWVDDEASTRGLRSVEGEMWDKMIKDGCQSRPTPLLIRKHHNMLAGRKNGDGRPTES
ncbi:hypothetical protein LTR22_024478 [Elasticomyces elasticus]|nr:hypothetical protein LTR22_024478 [Elasticomyces elasticus]